METSLDIKQLGDFGVNFRTGNKGDRHTFVVHRPMKRKLITSRELCVAGSKKLISAPAGADYPKLIKAGDDGAERPDLIPGTYVMEYLEDGSKDIHVCGHTPAVMNTFKTAAVKVAKGAKYVVKQGTAVGLFGDIELDNGERRTGLVRFFAKTRDVTFTAKTVVNGLAVWN